MLEIDQVGVPRLCKSSGLSITSRQQAPQVYDMNASIYGWKRDALFASQNLLNSGTRLFEMPAERSLDIDSEFDLYLVEKILTDMHKLSG